MTSSSERPRRSCCILEGLVISVVNKLKLEIEAVVVVTEENDDGIVLVEAGLPVFDPKMGDFVTLVEEVELQ